MAWECLGHLAWYAAVVPRVRLPIQQQLICKRTCNTKPKTTCKASSTTGSSTFHNLLAEALWKPGFAMLPAKSYHTLPTPQLVAVSHSDRQVVDFSSRTNSSANDDRLLPHAAPLQTSCGTNEGVCAQTAICMTSGDNELTLSVVWPRATRATWRLTDPTGTATVRRQPAPRVAAARDREIIVCAYAMRGTASRGIGPNTLWMLLESI